jgi:myo-inositol 2-dehydrogenase/D-chiro-inositol 1-dehydrogenase
MPAIVEEIEEFARCIRTPESPEIGGETALHNLAVVLAAVESAKSRGPVEVASLLEE